MSLRLLISALMGVLIIVRVVVIKDFQEAGVIAVGTLFILSLIRFNDFWATYILSFGWMESKATDFQKAEFSVPAVAMIGWILLLLLLYFAFFQTT